MADVISRIVLQASGGDQVAREVGKIKKAYEEAGESAKGMSASGGAGGGQSAFQRATTPPQSVVQAEGARSQGVADLRDAAERRRSAHEALAGRNTNAGQVFNARGATQGIQAATSMAGGDPVGGAAQGLGMVGKLGKAGIIGAVVAAAGIGTVRLAEDATERQRQLFYGLGQGLGQNEYDPFRNSVRSLEQQGLAPNLMEYLNALRSSGGQFDESAAARVLQLNYGMGVSAASLGQLQGRMNLAGANAAGLNIMDTDTAAGAWTATKAEQTFGRGRMGEFYSAIASAVEGAMTRGFERGSGIFQRVYTNYVQGISDFANFGNVGPEAAVGIFNKVQGAMARSERGLQTPQDAAAFIAMRQPGESYVDTILRMSSPEAEDERYRRLRDRAGGDRESLVLMVAQEFGLSIREADRYVDTKEGRISQDARNAAARARGDTGILPELDMAGTDVLRDQAAEMARKNLGQDVREGAADVVTNITEGIQNLGERVRIRFRGREGTPEQQAQAEVIRRALEGRDTSPQFGPQYGGVATEDYLNQFPPSVRDEILAMSGGGRPTMGGATMSGNMLDMAVGDQFRMYRNFQTGNTAGMSSAQLEYVTQHAQDFEEALALLDSLNGAIESGDVSGDDIANEVRKSNLNEDWDLNKSVVSILDILAALANLAEQNVQTDAGSTE